MSYIKSKSEIEKIVEGGKILGEILDTISKMAVPGASAFEIDKKAEELVKEARGRPAFKGYRSRHSEPPFPSVICACVNEELVHGIATKNKILKDGDIFSIDIGMQYPVNSGLGKNGNGFFTDTAITIAVGSVSNEAQKLLRTTSSALELAINTAVVGNTIADIGKEVQNYAEAEGYGVVRDLVGHGVGHDVHEKPRIPNFYDADMDAWKIEAGAVLALEPMVTVGDYKVITAPDGWSISTADGSLSAHFEHTVVITEDGPIVVTRRPSEVR